MTDLPLVFSLVCLPGQVGAMPHEDREWSTPVDLGTPPMSVSENTRIPLSVDLTSVFGDVLARVKTEVELKGGYVRCLDPASVHHEVDASDTYFETAPSPGKEDLEADDFLLIGIHDTIDLELLLRDAIVTLVDERPLYDEDCQGSCDVCGEKRADLPVDHSHESIDPRLTALTSLLELNQKEAD